MKLILREQNKVFFYGIFIGVLFLSYLTVRPILSYIILAFLVVGIFNPIYQRILQYTKSQSVAVTSTVILSLLSFIIPIIFIGFITVNQINTFIADLETFVEPEKEGQGSKIGSLDVKNLVEEVNQVIQQIPTMEDYEINVSEIREAAQDVALPAGEYVGNKILGFAGSTPKLLTNLILFITLIATLLPLQSKVKEFMLKVSPLEDKIDQIYIKKVNAMATSMIKGTFVIAIAQGSIAGLLLWIAGVEYVLFWTLISIFLSIIPVGAGLVNLPIAIVLLLTGQFWQAAVVIAGNLLVVGTVDNVLRPLLVSKDAELHPALVLIGVIGGIQAFGFLGFIYGPVIMIFLFTTFQVYIEHYRE